nr:RNA-directed DNA polymerase, eukaryota, reverse transcriptase zinc-binding domain protein [Tanacetum cinerariifolium]
MMKSILAELKQVIWSKTSSSPRPPLVRDHLWSETSSGPRPPLVRDLWFETSGPKCLINAEPFELQLNIKKPADSHRAESSSSDGSTAPKMAIISPFLISKKELVIPEQSATGLKQGDPLSPFLFILVMESLHISFQRVIDVGLFTGLKLNSMVTLSHLFYADDAIFVGKWSERNIDTLVHVLDCFYRPSGLRINMCKSKILGINVDERKIQNAATKLGCLILKTPFSYLGTKIGANMARKEAWKEVVDKVKSRLSKWKLKTLSIGCRFTLLKAVLGSTPIFHMSIYKVPLYVLNTLEYIRSRFFNGHEYLSRKALWVKWDKVLMSKEKGGLGVSSLYALNRDGGKLSKDTFNGNLTGWITIIKEMRILKDKGVNVMDFIRLKLGNDPSLVNSFRRQVRSGVEENQFNELMRIVQGTTLAPCVDRFIWSLESDGIFSVASIRKCIDNSRFQEVGMAMRWIKSVPNVELKLVLSLVLYAKMGWRHQSICFFNVPWRKNLCPRLLSGETWILWREIAADNIVTPRLGRKREA